MKTKLALLRDQGDYHKALADYKIEAQTLCETLQLITGKAPTISPPQLRESAGFLIENVEAMDTFCDTLKGMILQAKGPVLAPLPSAAGAQATGAPAITPASKGAGKPKLTLTEIVLQANGVTTIAELNSKHAAAMAAGSAATAPADVETKAADKPTVAPVVKAQTITEKVLAAKGATSLQDLNARHAERMGTGVDEAD